MGSTASMIARTVPTMRSNVWPEVVPTRAARSRARGAGDVDAAAGANSVGESECGRYATIEGALGLGWIGREWVRPGADLGDDDTRRLGGVCVTLDFVIAGAGLKRAVCRSVPLPTH